VARKILHLDLDAFFCAVEERRNPALKEIAFMVGGPPGHRGVVLSASYPARRLGIRSGMPMSRAVQLGPSVTIIPPRHYAYGHASQDVMDYLHDLTPLIEQVSIDEAFMDLTDLPEPGLTLASTIQSGIRAQFNLPCSIGIAANKLVAKTATDIGKARHRGDGPPYAILEVRPGEERSFLAPLPIQALWGIGPKSAPHFQSLGFHTIGDLAAAAPADLARHFGKLGVELSLRARGIDDRPVGGGHAAKSVSQERTYDQDVRDPKKLETTLRNLSEAVGYRLRQEGICGSTMRLKLRWSDFSTITRQVTLDEPTNQDMQIYSTVLALFHQAWKNHQPVRLLGVGVSGLGPPLRQLCLWENTTDKEQRLLEALDQLRERYGEPVVRRGAGGKLPSGPGGTHRPGGKGRNKPDGK
jgi:DNA polymerase-4